MQMKPGNYCRCLLAVFVNLRKYFWQNTMVLNIGYFILHKSWTLSVVNMQFRYNSDVNDCIRSLILCFKMLRPLLNSQVSTAPFKIVSQAASLQSESKYDTATRKTFLIKESEFFAPQFDYDFTNLRDTETFSRGGEVYKRPCGWFRLGLKVKIFFLTSL